VREPLAFSFSSLRPYISTQAGGDEFAMNFVPFKASFLANFYEKAMFVNTDVAVAL
jgi:hypothetical protein